MREDRLKARLAKTSLAVGLLGIGLALGTSTPALAAPAANTHVNPARCCQWEFMGTYSFSDCETIGSKYILNAGAAEFECNYDHPESLFYQYDLFVGYSF